MLEGYKKAHRLKYTSTLSIVNLGLLYTGQGKLGKAEKIYQQALKGNKKVLRPKYISTLSTVSNLGSLYNSQDKLGEAEKIYQ